MSGAAGLTAATSAGFAAGGGAAGRLPVIGATEVAASGDVCVGTGGTPRGGVGAAPRRGRRCPHSWQKTSWPGLSRPHVVQITQNDGTPARGRQSTPSSPFAEASERVLRLDGDLEAHELRDARAVRRGARIDE